MSSDGPEYPQYPGQGTDEGKPEQPAAPPSPPPQIPDPPAPPPSATPPPPPGQQWSGYDQSASGTPYGAVPPTNQKAMWSMILGIISILGVCFVVGGLLVGIPATILGFISRKEINAAAGGQQGRGMAIAGIVLGIIGIVFSLVLIAFYGYLFTTPEFQEGFREGYEGSQ